MLVLGTASQKPRVETGSSSRNLSRLKDIYNFDRLRGHFVADFDRMVMKTATEHKRSLDGWWGSETFLCVLKTQSLLLPLQRSSV